MEVTGVRGAGATAGGPAAAPETEPFDNIYFAGEQGGLNLRLRPQPGAPPQLLLRLRLVDVRQRQVAVQTRPLACPDRAEQSLEVRFTPQPYGCFKVALDAGTGPADLQWVEDLGSFTVLPRELYDRPRLPQSYFGGHMDGIHLNWHLRVGRKLGLNWARCHDTMQWTWWNRVQPDGPQQWRWSDEAQGAVDALGFQTQGEFLWVPRWAQAPGSHSQRNPATYPPDDLTAFGRYVFETVSHYRGSIHTWEVWNEPHYAGFFSGSPAQYGRLQQVAYEQCKRADPQCTVVGGGGVSLGSTGWLEQMLAAPGGRSMDAFSLHYLDPDTGPAQLKRLRELLAAGGFTGPLINSEESVESSSFLDQNRTEAAEPEARYHFRNACYELVRVYMENLANGIDRVFFYTLADPWRTQAFPKPRVFEHSPVNGLMWDEGQMLKPLAAAHAALALAIDGKPFQRRLAPGEAQVFLFGATGGEDAVAVQYALYPSYAQQGRLLLRLPRAARAGGFRRWDFLGNEEALAWRDGRAEVPLSREPRYLFYRGPRAPETLAGAYGVGE